MATTSGTQTAPRAEAETLPRAVLEQHWNAASQAMEDAGYDALLVCGRGMITQYGSFLYLGGFPLFLAHGYVFLRKGEPAQLVVGKRDQIVSDLYGVSDLVYRTSLGDVQYGLSTYTGLADSVSSLIAEHGLTRGTIGVVGRNDVMPIGDFEALSRLQPDVRFQDGASILGPLKAVKSDAELALYEEACTLTDDGFEAFLNEIAPGKTEAELVGAVEDTVRSGGALPLTIIQVLRDKMYTRPPTMQKLGRDELVCCYVEVVAPSGFWVEKGAMFSIGDVPDRWMEVYEASEKAYAAGEELLVAGRTAGDVGRAVRAVADEVGCDLGIQTGHGVGIDHDIPVLSEDDTTELTLGMVISLHPHLHDDQYGAMAIDQYTITNGTPIRHSRIPRQLFQVNP